MQKKTNPIVQLFPGFEMKIDFLLQNNENFRELCADYILCTTMVLDRKNEMNKNTAEIAEFEDLQRNLEEEILKELKKSSDII